MNAPNRIPPPGILTIPQGVWESAGRLVGLSSSVLVVVVLLLGMTGCTRSFYRQQADGQVYCLENQGSQAVGDASGALSITPAPPSRMFDPFSPDCPPMPPDDPVSHRLMQCVDGKWGWPGWDCYGKTPFVQNPNWEAFLPRDENGRVVIDRQAAMQLALCNSPDFQTQLENLYLSALDVTYQRFRFDAQFFGGNDTFFDAMGRERAGGSALSTLSTDTDVLMRKMSATGGEFVIGAANSLVWQFAGPDEYAGTTLLDFSLFQPLLRAGGRAVVLESLTDSERALVANIRQMERFRRGFYAEIIAGRNPGSGPSSGPITLGSLTPGGSGAIGGLMALLRQQVLIHNQRANVVSLRDSLEQLEAFYDALLVDYFQVEQTRLQYYQAQIRLLDLENEYKNALDTYKILLGLPPGLETQVNDPLLNRFQLISAELTDAQNRVTTLLANLRDPESGSVLADDVKQLDSIIVVSREQIQAVEQDIVRLDEALPTRREHLRQLADRPEFRNGDVDPSIVSTKLLDERVAKLKIQFAENRESIEKTLGQIESFQQRNAGNIPQSGPREEALRIELRNMVSELSGQMIALSLYQAEARLDTITLKPLDLAPLAALKIARTHRRDWKNARAALVDVWRQIQVTANELESDLDVTFSGDLSTVGDNPIRFRGTNGRLRVGFEFDAPLTRLAERNDYRRALINYQRARRQYYTYEDRIYQSLRRTLRDIRLAQINFEQRRAAVYVAATQVDIKQYDMLHKPPKANQRALSDVAARDVIDAINELLSQQNNFLEVWVGYEVQRINLAFDLGTMKLDGRGMWIDENSFESDLDEMEPEQAESIPPGIETPDVVEDDLDENEPLVLTAISASDNPETDPESSSEDPLPASPRPTVLRPPNDAARVERLWRPRR